MNRAVQSSNKALVLEAFDTLFNKRDYVAAERYWSPHYIQHSAHIEPGTAAMRVWWARTSPDPTWAGAR